MTQTAVFLVVVLSLCVCNIHGQDPEDGTKESTHTTDTVALKHLGDVPLYQSDFFEGDIVEIPDREHYRNGLNEEELLWPQAFVPYEIDITLASFNTSIHEALKEIQERTCINFQQRRSSDRDYLHFTKSEYGCSASLGRRGGEQLVSLGEGCHWKGIILHLIGHSLGLFHEHTRQDRDEYIDILWDNIEKGSDLHFEKLTFPQNTTHQNDSFSYRSIMMHGELAYSKDDLSQTIKPKNDSIIIGPLWNRTELDIADVRRLNAMYNCIPKNGNSNISFTSPARGFPSSFHCDFEFDDCGIKNQPNMRSSFIRTNQPIGGRSSHYMYLDITQHASSHGARLITKYFPRQRFQSGCLAFKYFMSGKGIESIVVTQQDIYNSEIWITSGSVPFWTTASMNVDLSRGSARFFIDALLNPKETEGIVGIDDIMFAYTPCKN